MKRFLTRFLFFIPCLIIGVSAKPYYLTIGNKYQKLPKQEWVYTALNKSLATEKKAKILVIGDSVGNQLFRVGDKRNYGEIYSLTCTAAIDIVGQYILMYNFLQNNKPDVVYIINSGYKSNLNAKQVFHYFLKPFYTQENKKHLTEKAQKQIKLVPYYFLARLPHIYTTSWGPKIPFVPDRSGKHISDLSAEYLHKMKKLADEHDVKFYALPPPIIASRKPSFDKHIKDEIAQREVGEIFKYYFDVLRYYPVKNFRDQIHLNKDVSFKYANNYRKLVREYSKKD